MTKYEMYYLSCTNCLLLYLLLQCLFTSLYGALFSLRIGKSVNEISKGAVTTE